MRAQSADEEIQQLEQKVEQLDQEIKVANRKAELKADDDAAKAKNGAHVTVDDTGFPKMSMFTIDELFGGWTKTQKTHFEDGGTFDKIYTPGA